MSEENAAKLMELIKTNFHHDIAHYTRHGQLSLENGVYDMEHRSAQELFLRSERRSKLMDELEAKREEWPSILKGIKMVDIVIRVLCFRDFRIGISKDFLLYYLKGVLIFKSCRS